MNQTLPNIIIILLKKRLVHSHLGKESPLTPQKLKMINELSFTCVRKKDVSFVVDAEISLYSSKVQ